MGANIRPEEHLRRAAAELRARFPEITFSHVYRSAPREHEDQPPFLNAGARVVTEEEIEEVSAALQKMEQALGKHIPFRFGPRTIDLDLLLYENLVLPSAEEWLALRGSRDAPSALLYLPHPRMHERRFVLEPLSELLSVEGRHPVLGKTWAELLRAVEEQECKPDKLTL